MAKTSSIQVPYQDGAIFGATHLAPKVDILAVEEGVEANNRLILFFGNND